MHVAGSKENFKYFIALVLKLLMKNIYIQYVFRLFVISLLTFSYFSPIISLFGAGAAPFFTAPAPAPAPSKLFRRLRLRLRLRPKCVGSGGSGSGSGSGSASLVGRVGDSLQHLYPNCPWGEGGIVSGISWMTPRSPETVSGMFYLKS